MLRSKPWSERDGQRQPLARGKNEGRGLIERAGGRPLRSVGANFHFFHLFAPLGGRVLKSAMAVSGRDWLDFRSVSAFIGCPHSDGGSRHPILTGQSSSRSLPLSLSLSLRSLRLLLASAVLFARSLEIPSRTGDLPLRRADTSLSLFLFFSGHGQESLCN